MNIRNCNPDFLKHIFIFGFADARSGVQACAPLASPKIQASEMSGLFLWSVAIEPSFVLTYLESPMRVSGVGHPLVDALLEETRSPALAGEVANVGIGDICGRYLGRRPDGRGLIQNGVITLVYKAATGDAAVFPNSILPSKHATEDLSCSSSICN
jgi:hypothetical protein